VGTGVEATPDTAAGTCPPGTANTLKDPQGNFCCAPIPCFGIGTSTEATPNSATGTCPANQVNDLKDPQGNFCCEKILLKPCTTPGQTGCVSCPGNTTGTCTATEALFVQRDIDKNIATGPGADSSATSCYNCLFNGGCLDDDAFGDTGNECGDFGATQFNGGSAATECQSTISCILGSNCASGAVSGCYCGTAGVSTACQGNPAPGPINGACDNQIATGLGFAVTDGTDNTKNLTDKTRPAGRADQIFQCAQSTGCGSCLN
jgi:hypothetical protein